MTTSSVTNNNGGGGGQANSTRNCSPDTDSAFCDNLSVLSSCSASSGEKKGGGGGSSGHSSGGSNHAVDEDARIKAEKIKLAIEKIKEASVKKLFIKVELYRYSFTVSSIL
jgi:amyloid beta A4 precursor protein-binding family B protein 1-interacting protein